MNIPATTRCATATAHDSGVLLIRAWPFGLAASALILASGCLTPGERAKLAQNNEVLRRDNGRLERTVAQREATIGLLRQQVQQLQGFGPDRPADLFAPVKMEIASRSGGDDYDGAPGDDGVTVYIRLRDLDGDIVKPAGSISVQLMDNSDLGAPMLIGVYRFDDNETLRKSWYGKFGTGHYTLKCPFPTGFSAPRRVAVKVEFTYYLTGLVLSAVDEVDVAPSEEHETNRSTLATEP